MPLVQIKERKEFRQTYNTTEGERQVRVYDAPVEGAESLLDTSFALGTILEEGGDYGLRVVDRYIQRSPGAGSDPRIVVDCRSFRIGSRPDQSEDTVTLASFAVERKRIKHFRDGGQKQVVVHAVPREHLDAVEELLDDGGRYNDPYSDWAATTDYVAGDAVRYSDAYYRCKEDIDGDAGNDDPATDTTHWYETIQTYEALHIDSGEILDEWPGRPGLARVLVRVSTPDQPKFIARYPAEGRAVIEASVSAHSYKATYDTSGKLIEGPLEDGDYYRQVIAGSNLKYLPRCTIRVTGAVRGPFPIDTVAGQVGKMGTGFGLGANTLLSLGAPRYRRVLGSAFGLVTYVFLYEPLGWDKALKSGKFQDRVIQVPIFGDADDDDDWEPTGETRTIHKMIRVTADDDGDDVDDNEETHVLHDTGSFGELPLTTEW
jgi:hypothetical protein